MLSDRRKEVGRAGEELAAHFLLEKGWELVAKNWRGAGVEIDLIFREGKEIVFVEVKTRKSGRAGYPEESITQTKRLHLARAAEAWWQQHLPMGPWRVDVVAIREVGSGRWEVRDERRGMRDGIWEMSGGAGSGSAGGGQRWEIVHFVGI